MSYFSYARANTDAVSKGGGQFYLPLEVFFVWGSKQKKKGNQQRIDKL